ncbi:SRPBCC domain-containing protein [Moheibacter stercoris]|uniref:Uncharacterized protein YndB with AHSA1/START domain n=1 Tax=Moheibacter stercoris TaxID=1628251 RepID=A0ABV2LVS7_9FLAO
MQKLTAKAKIAIQAQLQAVFEAIVNPEIMKNYFISKGSNRLEMGNEILWEFPEFEGSFPVEVMEIIPNQRIHFSWDSNSEVLIEFEKQSVETTIVMVHEMGYQNDEKGIQWVIGQTEGWANFLACLKAWMEYKIHLRKGAFDF